MYYLCRECDGQLLFENDVISLSGVHVQHTVLGKEQTVVLFASVPLSDEKWLAFEENQLVITKNGAIVQ
jgi:predicted glutamine amidotransferase